MFGLLPCQLNSPAPSVMPGTVLSASFNVVMPRSSSSLRGTVTIDCGTSRSGSVSFVSELSSTR